MSTVSLSAAQGSQPTLSPPAVSVIIVTYNGRDLAPACLQSLLDDPTVSQEIIVVDNQSTDGTPDLIRQQFPAVQVIENGANLGYGAAINIASAQARGAYLAVLNQDVVVAPGWLTPLVAALEAHPRAALATPKILLKQDPTRINTCGNTVHYTGITSCRGLGEPATAYATPEPLLAISGCAFLMRPSAFHAVGDFDGDFFLYLEDTELSLRCALAGYESRYVPESVVYHDFKLQFSPQKIYLLERNRHRMLLKVFSARTLVALAPALALAEVVTWGYSILRGPAHIAAKLRAYGWLWRAFPRLRQERQQVQALRRVSDRALLEQCASEVNFGESGGGPFARAAEYVLQPLFRLWYRVARRLVR